MHKVEFAPLIHREGAENGVVENGGTGSEFSGAAGHHVVEFRECRHDFGGNFFGLESARGGGRRRFSSRRHVSETDDNESLAAILPGDWRGQRFVGLEDTAESLEGSGVGQEEVFENFCGAPLVGIVPAELLGREPGDHRGEFALQSGKVRVHGCHLPFSSFRIE